MTDSPVIVTQIRVLARLFRYAESCHIVTSERKRGIPRGHSWGSRGTDEGGQLMGSGSGVTNGAKGG